MAHLLEYSSCLSSLHLHDRCQPLALGLRGELLPGSGVRPFLTTLQNRSALRSGVDVSPLHKSPKPPIGLRNVAQAARCGLNAHERQPPLPPPCPPCKAETTQSLPVAPMPQALMPHPLPSPCSFFCPYLEVTCQAACLTPHPTRSCLSHVNSTPGNRDRLTRTSLHEFGGDMVQP